MPTDLDLLPTRLLKDSQKAGAEQAEVWVQEGTRLTVRVRQGAVEELTEATTRSLHLRVYVEQRLGRTSCSDLHIRTLGGLAKRTVEHAWKAGQDSFAGLPEKAGHAPEAETLDLYDESLGDLGAASATASAAPRSPRLSS